MTTLRQHRLQQVWTIRDLARAAQVSHQSIVSAEAGKPLRITTMRKIAQALSADVWDIEEFAAILTAMGEGEEDSKLAA